MLSTFLIRQAQHAQREAAVAQRMRDDYQDLMAYEGQGRARDGSYERHCDGHAGSPYSAPASAYHGSPRRSPAHSTPGSAMRSPPISRERTPGGRPGPGCGSPFLRDHDLR